MSVRVAALSLIIAANIQGVKKILEHPIFEDGTDEI